MAHRLRLHGRLGVMSQPTSEQEETMTRISWERWAALAVSLERLERRSARAAATRGENDLGRLIRTAQASPRGGRCGNVGRLPRGEALRQSARRLAIIGLGVASAGGRYVALLGMNPLPSFRGGLVEAR